MSESEWTKILGWPGYRVYRSEINEEAKTLRLWVRRKRGNRKLECSGCGRRIDEIAEVYEREVRDLPCFEYRTTVVIELYRLRCPECGFFLAFTLKWQSARPNCGRIVSGVDLQPTHQRLHRLLTVPGRRFRSTLSTASLRIWVERLYITSKLLTMHGLL